MNNYIFQIKFVQCRYAIDFNSICGKHFGIILAKDKPAIPSGWTLDAHERYQNFV